MELNKDFFKELAKEHYGVEMPKVEKVAFGDVMFYIEHQKAKYETKINACTQMIAEYMLSDETIDVCMKHSLQGRIDTYKEILEDLETIQNKIYKKVL